MSNFALGRFLRMLIPVRLRLHSCVLRANRSQSLDDGRSAHDHFLRSWIGHDGGWQAAYVSAKAKLVANLAKARAAKAAKAAAA